MLETPPARSTCKEADIDNIPYSYCHCGCGKKTKIAHRSDTGRRLVKGEPMKYIYRHGVKRYGIDSLEPGELTPDLAYVLGFVLADGNVFKNTVTVVQAKPDVLYKIKAVLRAGHPVRLKRHKKTGSTWHAIHLGNQQLVNWLKSFGVTECKSLNATLPCVPGAFLPHMVRGYFDGDGSSTYTHRAGLEAKFTSGSIVLLEQLSGELLKISDSLNKQAKPRKENPRAYDLKYFGSSALSLADWMYKDCGELFLERKRTVFERYRNRPAVSFDSWTEKRGYQKITGQQAAEIRAKLQQSSPRQALATEYGVSRSTIEAIATGRVWRV